VPESRPLLQRLSAAVLTLNLAGILFSFCSTLFGPWWGCIIGTIGFLVGICALAFGDSKPGKKLFGPPWQGLAEEVPALQRLRGPMGVLILIILGIIIISMIVMVFVSGFAGVIDGYYVLETCDSYMLNSHGVRTEVSRLRYVAVGVSFFAGWHSGASLPSLLSLYYVLFGELPKWMKNRQATS
jgi:hypothetical protein